MTNSGGGYLRWLDLDVTRWRADTTCDVSGRFVTSGIWKAERSGATPINRCGLRSAVTPGVSRRTKRSSGGGADRARPITEIVVSAEDDAEVRRVTLVNTSRKPCRLELTSYLELALAPHRADRAHPAFNKLFIETEWLPHCEALVARRRLRAPDDQPVWAAHLMVAEPSTFIDSIEFETDRAQFLGRGRTPENPEALTRSLTNSVGAVLDPIFSLRRRVTILPNQRFQFALVTVVAESREAVIALVERYSEFHTCARAFETAWTHSQLEMRRLHIRPADVQTFQQLAAPHSLSAGATATAAGAARAPGRGSAGALAQGISGDLPIVVVMIGHLRDIEVVREILTAHTFWHLRGLKVDLVLVSEEVASYDEPLTAHLRRLTEAQAHLTGVDQPGGVYLRSATKISKEELIALAGAPRGWCSSQLAAHCASNLPRPPRGCETASVAAPGRQFREEPSAPLAFMELKYFNGLGGFTEDGKEFVIYLGPGPTDAASLDQHHGQPEVRRIGFRVRRRMCLGPQQPERSPHAVVQRSDLRSARNRHLHPR